MPSNKSRLAVDWWDDWDFFHGLGQTLQNIFDNVLLTFFSIEQNFIRNELKAIICMSLRSTNGKLV